MNHKATTIIELGVKSSENRFIEKPFTCRSAKLSEPLQFLFSFWSCDWCKRSETLRRGSFCFAFRTRTFLERHSPQLIHLKCMACWRMFRGNYGIVRPMFDASALSKYNLVMSRLFEACEVPLKGWDGELDECEAQFEEWEAHFEVCEAQFEVCDVRSKGR